MKSQQLDVWHWSVAVQTFRQCHSGQLVKPTVSQYQHNDQRWNWSNQLVKPTLSQDQHTDQHWTQQQLWAADIMITASAAESSSRLGTLLDVTASLKALGSCTEN